MKRFFLGLIVFVFAALLPYFTADAHADSLIPIYVNGIKASAGDSATIVKQYTYVTTDTLNHLMSTTVSWDKAKGSVTLKKSGWTLQLAVNSKQATLNGKKTVLEAPPYVQNNKLLLPVKSVGKLANVQVTWDNLSRSLFLFTASTDPGKKPEDSGASGTGSENPPEDSNNGSGSTSGSGPDAEETNPSNSGSDWNADGDGGIPPVESDSTRVINSIQITKDQVSIEGSSAMQGTTLSLSNPDRIVVDIPNAKLGATVNGLPAGQAGEFSVIHEKVGKIRYSNFTNSPSSVRVVLDLNKKTEFSLMPDQANNRLLVLFRAASTNKMKVVIDAGHGGSDPGAIGASKQYEKNYTLAVTKKVYDLLLKEPMLDPYLTRSADTYPTLADRVKIANDLEADLFISIHGNVVDKAPAVGGTETYYSRSDSKAFADIVHRHLLEALGFNDRKVRQSDFYVVKNTKMPAVLLELGYLSNKDEEAKLLDPSMQEAAAEAIVTSIKEFYGI